MPEAVKDWSDFEGFLTNYLPAQLVATLRSIGTYIELATGYHLAIRTQERKDNLIEKVRFGFREMQRKDEFEKYRGVRLQAEQIGKPYHGYGARGYMPASPVQAPTFGGAPAAPRQPAPPPAGPSRSGWNAAPARPQHALQDWKSNPMFRAVKAVTAMEMLPDINHGENSHSHRDKRVSFYLGADVVEKLQQSRNNPNAKPLYSLRIFCTSSEYYRPPGAPAVGYMSNKQLPIDFPSNPDVTFSGAPMVFKDRGLRGKPGSAPPFDLGKVAFSLNADRLNSLSFGHTGPTPSKKKDTTKRFFFQICLAEITSKEALLDQLLQVPTLSAHDSLAESRRKMDDDDIIADSFKLSLKDPLAYTRISRPVRSTKCTHIQCFDPKWWIEGNSQHPQFLCPLCSKALQFGDLIIDGFFQSILDAVPDTVDEVIVDSSFEWKSEDGKYSSMQPAQPAPLQLAPAPPSPDPSRQPTPRAEGKCKAIEILSSDEEDEVPLANHRITPATSASVGPSNDVIDLTLDDSDDEEAPSQASQRFREPSSGQGRSDGIDLGPSTSLPLPKGPEIDTGARLESFAAYKRPQPKYRDPHKLPGIDISPFDMNIDGMTQGTSYAPAYNVDRWPRPPPPEHYPSFDRSYERYAPVDRWEDNRNGKRHRTASEWMHEDYRSRNDPLPQIVSLASNNSHLPLTVSSSGPPKTEWREQAVTPDSPWCAFSGNGPSQIPTRPSAPPPTLGVPTLPIGPIATPTVSVNFGFSHLATQPFTYSYPPLNATPGAPYLAPAQPSMGTSTGVANLDTAFSGLQPGLAYFGLPTNPSFTYSNMTPPNPQPPAPSPPQPISSYRPSHPASAWSQGTWNHVGASGAASPDGDANSMGSVEGYL